MSADKRSVSTDALATLGTLIQDGGRDAIHLAVEPIIAAEQLYPGQHIGIVDGKATTKSDKKLGIVDPFISGLVPEGAKFWLIVYPRQITSLRHVWEHPDFGQVQVTISSKQFSEGWLRDFCEKNDCPQYEIVIAAAVGEYVEGVEGYGSAYEIDGQYFHFNGRDAHSAIPPEFWDHVEIVTGKKPPHRAEYFSCGC